MHYVEYGFCAFGYKKGKSIHIKSHSKESKFYNGSGDWEVIKHFLPEDADFPQVWAGYNARETPPYETGRFQLMHKVTIVERKPFTYNIRVPFLGKKTIEEVSETEVNLQLADYSDAKWCYWRTTPGIEVNSRQTNYIQFVLFSKLKNESEVWQIIDKQYGRKDLFPVFSQNGERLR